MITSLRACLLALVAALGAGCAGAPVAKAPMDSVTYAQPQAHNRQLFVFLPGIRSTPEDYVEQGFIDAVRSRGLPIDMIAVDAHLGYYTVRNLVERLKTDVIRRAQEQGYQRIWLVGTSLGALGSLIYAMEYPADVQGLFLLGPFLGDPEIVDEISEAGGLRDWRPDMGLGLEDERKLWAWLKGYEKRDNGLPSLYLGYGRNDRFAEAAAVLAAVLPPDRVYVIPGRHRWRTWKKLWDKALDDAFFAETQAAAIFASRTELAHD